MILINFYNWQYDTLLACFEGGEFKWFINMRGKHHITCIRLQKLPKNDHKNIWDETIKYERGEFNDKLKILP